MVALLARVDEIMQAAGCSPVHLVAVGTCGVAGQLGSAAERNSTQPAPTRLPA